jgi:hypothetical protein
MCALQQSSRESQFTLNPTSRAQSGIQSPAGAFLINLARRERQDLLAAEHVLREYLLVGKCHRSQRTLGNKGRNRSA